MLLVMRSYSPLLRRRAWIDLIAAVSTGLLLFALVVPLGAQDAPDTPDTEQVKETAREGADEAKKKLTEAIKKETGIDLENVTIHDVIDQVPAVVAIAVAAICFIPLLWGWKLSRLVYTLLFAIGLGFGAFVMVGSAQPDQIWLAAIAGAVGAGLGGAFGWYSIKIGTAVAGATLLALIFGVIGMITGLPVVGVVLALIGGLIGLILGWKAAHYLEAISTAISSAVLMGAFTGIAAMDASPTLAIAGGFAIFVAASILGCIYQIKSVHKAETTKTVSAGEMKQRVEKSKKKK